MFCRPFNLIICNLISFTILAACATPTEIIAIPSSKATWVFPVTNEPQATDIPVTPTSTIEPTPTLEPSKTATSIIKIPVIERVSVASDGTQGNDWSDYLTISSDGHYAAFMSFA